MNDRMKRRIERSRRRCEKRASAYESDKARDAGAKPCNDESAAPSPTQNRRASSASEH